MKRHTPKLTTHTAAGGALTGSYVAAGSVMSGHGYDQICLLLAWTKGDETSMELKVEFSDSEDFAAADTYRDGSESVAAGVSTVTAKEYKLDTASKNVMIRVDCPGLYWKASVKATAGTPTGTYGLKSFMRNVNEG